MSLRKTTSIFSRSFKTKFNDKKYMNYMAREGDEYTHMPFYSRIDLTAGRITLTLTAVILTLSAWFKPDFLHETFGHLPPPPSHDNIGAGLNRNEVKLNRQLIHREHEEHKMESFAEVFKSYE